MIEEKFKSISKIQWLAVALIAIGIQQTLVVVHHFH